MSIIRQAVLFLATVGSSLCATLEASNVNRRDSASAYSINTDAHQKAPTSYGKVVPYTLTITNTTCNLAGEGDRVCMLVNGQYPGPTLRAKWGDTFQITIVNKLQNNGTAIHFHGIRQLNTPGSDGVNGITQCAIAPGDSATYSFAATQYGSSWYHSHTSVQYGDGVVGGIVIDGPAVAPYDVDLGPYIINDWYGTQTAWQAAVLSQQALNANQGPPLPTSMIINGTSKNPNALGTGGTYAVTKIKKGKRYRLRLVNASTTTYIHVSLDYHKMKVIAADFNPIKPYTADWLLIGIGQRYDVIITANQAKGDYWFRSVWPFSCYGMASNPGYAIWTYNDVAGTPTQPLALPATPEPLTCQDEQFTMFWPGSVPSTQIDDYFDLALDTAFVTPEGHTLTAWTLNKPIWLNYSDPTIGYLQRGDTDYPRTYNTVNTVQEGGWNYWVIINNSSIPSIPHPIHLHGHDFYVLGSAVGIFSQATANLNFKNPRRRDTESVPGNGWLVIAFKSDNPGAWLMHCHIVFHSAEGLGMQWIEQPDKVVYPDSTQYNRVCQNWNKYKAGEFYDVDESGV